MNPIPAEPFSVTITEEDMRNSGSYSDCQSCLIGTAIHRKFHVSFDNILVDPYRVSIRDAHGLMRSFTPSRSIRAKDLTGNKDSDYRPELVGQTFTFTPVK